MPKINKCFIRFLKDNRMYTNKIKKKLSHYETKLKNNPITFSEFVLGSCGIEKTLFTDYLTQQNEKYIEEIFNKTLRENNAYDAFYLNCKHQQRFTYKYRNPSDKMMSKINDAFKWDETTQGYKFWLDMQNSWIKTFWETLEKIASH